MEKKSRMNKQIVREMKAQDYCLAELPSGEPVITTMHHENDDKDYRVLTDEECIGVFTTWMKNRGYNKAGASFGLGPDAKHPYIKIEVLKDFEKDDYMSK